jgi:diketogulonate reductase-like aldo/keto reductase
MNQHPFGSTNRDVPVIGQGTWYIESGDRATGIAALRTGLDRGMTHIDTAEMYGSGRAEDLVGEAIAGRRDGVFLVSKVLPQHANRDGMLAACDSSLARLRTDYLDCYLLHWRGQYPLDETLAGFDQLVRDGKIRSWGVSNFDVNDLEELMTLAGDNRPACNQVLYHLQERAIEHGVLPWCEHNGIAVVGYSPFGHASSLPGAHTDGGRVLNEIATAHHATPRQIALAFLVRKPALFTIPKAADPRHVEDNAASGDLALTEDDIARIDSAFATRNSHRLPTL